MDALHLVHHEADQCVCGSLPGHRQLDQLQIRYTYVSTEGPAYKEHFGAREHSCSHWLSLDLPAGWWDLARFLFMHPNAASSVKRMPRPCDCSRGSVFAWNRLWGRSLKKPCYLSTAEKVRKTDLLGRTSARLGRSTTGVSL